MPTRTNTQPCVLHTIDHKMFSSKKSIDFVDTLTRKWWMHLKGNIPTKVYLNGEKAEREWSVHNWRKFPALICFITCKPGERCRHLLRLSFSKSQTRFGIHLVWHKISCNFVTKFQNMTTINIRRPYKEYNVLSVVYLNYSDRVFLPENGSDHQL